MLKETTIVDLTNNLTIIFVAKYSETVEIYANESLNSIETWFEIAELNLAE